MSKDVDELRTRVRDLIIRATDDSGLRSRMTDDPEAVLREHSLGLDDVKQLSGEFRELRISTELRCNDYTCWSSECPGSCYVTVCMTTFW